MADPQILALIEALAVAEVDDYMTAKDTPSNDPSKACPNPPATDGLREAA